MNLRDKVNAEYLKNIEDNYDLNKAAAAAMMEDIRHSSLYFNGRLLDNPLAMQKIYAVEDIESFKATVEIMHRICVKAIKHYLENPAYRKLFDFSKELEDLILVDPGYDAPLPMARFDIFYNEENGSFKFCEINTDGTSAMNEDYMLDQINIKNPAHQAIRRKYQLERFETFDSWVETLLGLYGQYRANTGKGAEVPNVAVCDFIDKGIVTEFYEFARRFQKAGVNSQVLDLRDLRYENGKLLSPEGYVVDAIYRRAVTSDIMEEWDNVQPFIQAYRDGNVFLCGPIRSQVVHTKEFFTVMHRPETKALLTEEENAFISEHIPYTCEFREEGISLAEVIENKDKYIIKPNDSYGSNSVADGKGRTQGEWEEIVRAAYGTGYICQEYATQYATKNIDFLAGSGKVEDYINMNGLYSYNGKFTGIFTRQAAGTIIASHGTERNVASYVVTGEK